MSPQDRDAPITKVKDGRTHLTHNVEHAVDLKSGAVLPVTLQEADAGESDVIPAGVPMVLSHIGAGNEREIPLVLHDASKPWTTKAYDWKPAGACAESAQ